MWVVWRRWQGEEEDSGSVGRESSVCAGGGAGRQGESRHRKAGVR